jgi:hypothetical protein
MSKVVVALAPRFAPDHTRPEPRVQDVAQLVERETQQDPLVRDYRLKACKPTSVLLSPHGCLMM